MKVSNFLAGSSTPSPLRWTQKAEEEVGTPDGFLWFSPLISTETNTALVFCSARFGWVLPHFSSSLSEGEKHYRKSPSEILSRTSVQLWCVDITKQFTSKLRLYLHSKMYAGVGDLINISSLSFLLIVREEKRIWKVDNCVFMKAETE